MQRVPKQRVSTKKTTIKKKTHLTVRHELRLQVNPGRAHEHVVVDLALEHVGDSLGVGHLTCVHVEHRVELLPSESGLADLVCFFRLRDGGGGQRDPGQEQQQREGWKSCRKLHGPVFISDVPVAPR